VSHTSKDNEDTNALDCKLEERLKTPQAQATNGACHIRRCDSAGQRETYELLFKRAPAGPGAIVFGSISRCRCLHHPSCARGLTRQDALFHLGRESTCDADAGGRELLNRREGVKGGQTLRGSGGGRDRSDVLCVATERGDHTKRCRSRRWGAKKWEKASRATHPHDRLAAHQ
jgi:hypothetical protein